MLKFLIPLILTLQFNQKQYCVINAAGRPRCEFPERQNTYFKVQEDKIEEWVDSTYNVTLYIKETSQEVYEGDTVISFTTSIDLKERGDEYVIVHINKSCNELRLFRFYQGAQEIWTFYNIEQKKKLKTE